MGYSNSAIHRLLIQSTVLYVIIYVYIISGIDSENIFAKKNHILPQISACARPSALRPTEAYKRARRSVTVPGAPHTPDALPMGRTNLAR